MEQKKSNLFLAEEMHLNDAQMNIIQGGGDDTMHDSFCSCGCQGRVQLPTTRLPTLMVVRHHQAILHVTVSSKE